MPDVSLKDLQQQITQRELELQTLRQKLETRQSELTTLVRRKEGLLAELRQIDAEMTALAANLPSQATVKSNRSLLPEKTKKATTQAARPIKPASAAKKISSPGATTSKAAKATGLVRQGSQPTLREVLTNVLKKSKKFLSGRELAEQALAAGYRSNSANFADVVWSMLGQMDNVEHMPEKGYRLKNTKARS